MSIQEQKQKGKKTYEELLSDAKGLMSKTAAVFIPQLCNALKEEQPNLKNEEIKEKIIFDCEGIYVYDTIRHSWPSWIIDEQAQRNRKIGWEKINKEKLNSVGKITTSLSKIELPETKLPEPREKEVDWDETLPGKFREIGEKGTTVLGQLAVINGGIAQLFKGLTDIDHLPHDDEDLVNDYIKPTRQFRQNLVLELDNQDTTRLWNRLGAIDAIVQDMLDLIEKNKKGSSKKR